MKAAFFLLRGHVVNPKAFAILQNGLWWLQDAIDAKIEGVNSLVQMLGCSDVEKMSVTFEAMSSSPDNCELMRSHRVVPVLIGVLHVAGVSALCSLAQ